MAGGLTYQEVVLGQAADAMRAEADAKLRDWLTSLGYDTSQADHYKLQSIRYRHELDERTRRDEQFRREREEHIAQRERHEVACAPSRRQIARHSDRCSTWRDKQVLGIELESSDATQRDRVAYEWGYIKALRDLGQTEEAERLIKKMRRGSIFRKERNQTAPDVCELEKLYQQ
jgi:hypothetical protein